MSVLVVRFDTGDARASDTDRRVERSLRWQRASDPVQMRWRGGSATWWGTLEGRRGSGAAVIDGDRFAAIVGTAVWRGLTGRSLLASWLASGHDSSLWPVDACLGSFVLLAGDAEGAWLLHDAIGLGKAYEVPSAGVVSTSLLVCRSALRSLRIEPAAARRYVLLGASHTDETPIAGVRLLDPTGLRRFSPHGADDRVRGTRWLPQSRVSEDTAALSTRIADTLREQFDQMHAAGLRRFGVAVTGGFDSRLVLALLHSMGTSARMFVYGRDDDDDVRVALRIGETLGQAVSHLDKSTLYRTLPPLDSDGLDRSMRFFDGLPPDGVMDRGADRLTRIEQFADEHVNLNGGGGEILRNFFYLRDRRSSALHVVDAFYTGGLLRGVFPTDEDFDTYRIELAQSMLRALGPDFEAERIDRPLDRRCVELLYPLFRCRHWMGVNNAVSSRHGTFMTPLINAELVKLSVGLPLSVKHFGQLQADVINRVSPRVASVTSGYGFAFTSAPTIRYRAKVLTTLARPLWLRRRSAALRRAAGRSVPPRVPDEWFRLVRLDAAEGWIRPERLTSLDQWNRLFSLCALVDARSAEP